MSDKKRADPMEKIASGIEGFDDITAGGLPLRRTKVPFVIGPAGVEVGSSNGVHPEPQPFNERISTGIARLDAMLCGGFYRGTNAFLPKPA